MQQLEVSGREDLHPLSATEVNFSPPLDHHSNVILPFPWSTSLSAA